MIIQSVGMMLAAISAVQEVEIKVYLEDKPQLIASVPVNGSVELAGAGGLRVGGVVAQDQAGGDVSYSLNFADARGHTDSIFVTVPFESCTQKAVDLGVRYVVRLCGAALEGRGDAHG